MRDPLFQPRIVSSICEVEEEKAGWRSALLRELTSVLRTRITGTILREILWSCRVSFMVSWSAAPSRWYSWWVSLPPPSLPPLLQVLRFQSNVCLCHKLFSHSLPISQMESLSSWFLLVAGIFFRLQEVFSLPSSSSLSHLPSYHLQQGIWVGPVKISPDTQKTKHPGCPKLCHRFVPSICKRPRSMLFKFLISAEHMVEMAIQHGWSTETYSFCLNRIVRLPRELWVPQLHIHHEQMQGATFTPPTSAAEPSRSLPALTPSSSTTLPPTVPPPFSVTLTSMESTLRVSSPTSAGKASAALSARELSPQLRKMSAEAPGFLVFHHWR